MTLIIAEIGVNHNGDMDMARELIDVAADAGADIVKFQTFKADELVTKNAQKAEYQKKTSGAEESQYDMLKRLELSDDDHRMLKEYAEEKGVEFLSTPFGLRDVDFLNDLGVKRFKISSGDVTNGPLLLKIAQTGKTAILSTGTANLEEVGEALAVMAFGYAGSGAPSADAFKKAFESEAGKNALAGKVTVLHCTTQYPTPLEDINLRAMDTIHETYDVAVGYSDHSAGILVPIAAAARGAFMIEKHITLDRNLPGPDHAASIEPEELREMVAQIRAVEKTLGSPEKKPAPSELPNIPVARKSLVAACDIKEGETFSEDNLTAKRPGDGVSPMKYWDYIGKTATGNYKKDGPL